MKTSIPAVLLLAACCGCSSSRSVSVSPGFHHGATRVGVLPFERQGDTIQTSLETLSDQLTEGLMERGTAVVDRELILAEAAKDSVDLRDPAQVAHLAKRLGLDGLFTGTVHYRYDAPSSGAVSPMGNIVVDAIVDVVGALLGSKDSTTTTHETVPGSYANSGGYHMDRIEIHYVEAEHSDSVLDASAPAAQFSELVADIRKRLP